VLARASAALAIAAIVKREQLAQQHVAAYRRARRHPSAMQPLAVLGLEPHVLEGEPTAACVGSSGMSTAGLQRS
jgi:hypothetical protein